MEQIIIEFDSRSDSGPRRVGPFPDRATATEHVDHLKLADASWNLAPLTSPEEDQF